MDDFEDPLPSRLATQGTALDAQRPVSLCRASACWITLVTESTLLTALPIQPVFRPYSGTERCDSHVLPRPLYNSTFVQHAHLETKRVGSSRGSLKLSNIHQAALHLGQDKQGFMHLAAIAGKGTHQVL